VGKYEQQFGEIPIDGQQMAFPGQIGGIN
jgi:hypothetical protein